MNFIKRNRLSLIWFVLIILYTFFIFPYPDAYPILNHRFMRPLLIVIQAVLFHLDDKFYKSKERTTK